MHREQQRHFCALHFHNQLKSLHDHGGTTGMCTVQHLSVTALPAAAMLALSCGIVISEGGILDIAQLILLRF